LNEIRLFVSTTEVRSAIVLDDLSELFGEEDFAIATMEMDEKQDIWEASVYLMPEDEAEVRPRIQAMLDERHPDLALQFEKVPDIDWIAKSLEGLKPVRAGRFLVHGSHDRATRRPNDYAIEIEAGQAFGTGHHGTTAGCLEMIHAVMKARRFTNMLDLGTGSGVLAIAARMMTPARMLATDIDPVATRVAAENARLNGMGSSIHFATAPGFHSPVFDNQGPFDLIIANILARPLMKLAPVLVTHLAPGGTVILSGILASQRWKVLAHYNQNGCAHRRTIWRNGWVTIVLNKSARN